MSILAGITQIIWPSIPCVGGYGASIRMTRCDPRFAGAGQYDAGSGNKIYLDQTLSPRLVSDIQLSQALQTTNGKSQLDNVTIQFLDVHSYAYSTTLGGSQTTEDLGDSTFFTEWFNDTAGLSTKQYKYNLWIDWFGPDGTLIETPFLFKVDPKYKPQDQHVQFPQNGHFSPYVRKEILREGSLRTILCVAVTMADTLFQATLNLIGPSDCVQGAGYMGYVYLPESVTCNGGFYSGVFTNGTSAHYLMQATPYQHGYDGNLYNNVGGTTGGSDDWPDSLPWDVSNTSKFGPDGSWWISLGTLISKIAASPGQIFATDGVLSQSGGHNILTSAGAQFTNNLAGLTINFSLPGNTGVGTATINSVTSPTQIVLSSNYTGGSQNIYWWIDPSISGSNPQAFLFDVTAQLGSPSAVATESLKVLKQLPDAAHFCYPIDTSTGQILPKDIYISVNAFFGSHPFGGTLWNNPIAFSPTATNQDVLQWICNFILAEYNIVVDQTAKQGRIVLDPIGQTGSAIPSEWIPAPKFQELEPSTGSTAVSVQNTGTGPSIMCPLSSDISNLANYSVPIRLHEWGIPLPLSGDLLFLGTHPTVAGSAGASGTVNATSNTAQSIPWGLTFDNGSPILNQSDNCFKVVWFDANGNPQPNPDCWKGLCYAMWRDTSGTNVMYPTSGGFNTPLQNGNRNGGWPGQPYLSDAFYALGAFYAPAETPIANEPNRDRFNSIDFPAVVLATFQIQTLTTLLQRDYTGVTDSTGSLMNVNIGMTGTWFYDNADRDFAVTELPRYLIDGKTEGVKLQEVPASGYPDLSSLIYGILPNASGAGGGSSISTDSALASGQIISQLTYAANPIALALSTSTTNDNLPITGATFVNLSGTLSQPGDITGLQNSGARPAVMFRNSTGFIVTFKNNSGSSLAGNRIGGIAASDFSLQNGDNITFVYDIYNSLWIPLRQSSIPGIAITVAGNTNDWIVPYIADYLWVHTTGNFNITGLAGGYDGLKVTIFNRPDSTGTLTATNLDGLSNPINQFEPGGNIGIGPNHSATFVYSGASTGLFKWLRISYT